MSIRYVVIRPETPPTKPHVLWQAIRKVRQYESKFDGPWTIRKPDDSHSEERYLEKTLDRLRYLLRRAEPGEEYVLRRKQGGGPTRIKVVEKVSYPPLRPPGCYTDDELGLVTKTFHFKGKGRDVDIAVKLVPQAMEALERAIARCPSIQVTQSYTSVYSGSYRNCTQQAWLRMKYESGEGYLAAPAGKSYHQTGRAVDLYQVTDAEHAAMRAEGFYDLLPQDPPHHTYGGRG